MVELHQDEDQVRGEENEVWRGGGDDVPLVGTVCHAHAVSQPAIYYILLFFHIETLPKPFLMEQIMVDVGHKRIFAEVEFAHEMWIAVITELLSE